MARKSAKRARTARVERDWRATLFVWRGALDTASHTCGAPMLEWKGAWLGTDDDSMPSDADLKASPNTFELETEPFDEEAIRAKGERDMNDAGVTEGDVAEPDVLFECIDMQRGGADEDDPEGLKAFFVLPGLYEMEFSGSYLLDNGDGLQRTEDTEHKWAVRTDKDDTFAAVAAVGTTPFGRFVSLGVIEGETMTLARRYIDDSDPRIAWTSPDAVLDAVLGGGDDFAAGLDLAEIPSKLPWKVEE